MARRLDIVLLLWGVMETTGVTVHKPDLGKCLFLFFLSIFTTALTAGCDGETSVPLPCDVDAVFTAKCSLCHNPGLAFGAPMTLDNWEVTQEPSKSVRDSLLWEQIILRIKSSTRPMPPAGLPGLSVDELEIIDRWVDNGVPPGRDECPG